MFAISSVNPPSSCDSRLQSQDYSECGISLGDRTGYVGVIMHSCEKEDDELEL